MTEPFRPHPDPTDGDRVGAAEPGQGAPEPAAAEEPDVLPGAGDADPVGGGDLDPAGPETPFRTPVPGDRLTPEELQEDDAG